MSKRNENMSGGEIVAANLGPGSGLDVIAAQLVDAAQTEGIALTGGGHIRFRKYLKQIE